MSDLATVIRDLMPRIQGDLERLVRIPSVGFAGHDPANVRDSAIATMEILSTAGVQDLRLIELDGGHPAVFGEIPAPEGAPTVLLYAHHDVQPEGPVDEWTSPPYEPEIRDGRLYGRGVVDDKSGIVMHAAAVAAFEGRPPVGVKVLVEGEEECSTEHLDFLIREHADLLAADVAIVADAGMYRSGTPGLTISIRGVVSCIVEIRTVDKALHSGEFGGPIPDAIMSLARIITRLHTDDGEVAVAGLMRSPGPGPEVEQATLWSDAGVRPGVERLGSGPLADQMLRGPSISVVGIDAPTIRESSFQIVPVARAKVTMRLHPSEDPERALALLIDHIRGSVPWGVEVDIQPDDVARGFESPTGGPFFAAHARAMSEAWGTEPVAMGMGGSVPLVPIMADTFPGIEILMTGPGDERAGAHSVDESLDLAELERACLAEALFLRYAAEAP